MDINCTKCKCWIRPFEPPDGCFACCTAKILRYAKPNELNEYLKIEENLSEKIFEISSDDSLLLLINYRRYLSEEEFDLVFSAFENISEKGWNWIATVLRERIETNEFVYS